MRSRSSLLQRLLALLTLALTLALYSLWATSLQPFTRPALAATLAGGFAFMILGSRFRSPSDPSTRSTRLGALVWLVLAVLLVVWELVAFFQQPRADHPTISHLANMVLAHHPARSIAFLLWLLIAMDLSRR